MMQFDGLWRNPAFLRFWAADAVSVFGSLITRIALPFTAILMLDASAFEMSLLVMADLVPSCVVGLPVGVWVDRRRRLPLMIAADVMRAAVLVSIPIAAAFDALTLVQLYAVAFVASALTVLFNVAQISILPALVSREDLLEANSKTSATQSVSEIGAFGIGGWLVQLLSGPGAILIDAVSFLASAVLLRSVPVNEMGPAPEVRSRMRHEIVAGLSHVWRQPLLRATALASTALWFGFSIFGTIISLFALKELGFEAGPLAMIFAVGGVSSLLGSVLVRPVTRALGVGLCDDRRATGGGTAVDAADGSARTWRFSRGLPARPAVGGWGAVGVSDQRGQPAPDHRCARPPGPRQLERRIPALDCAPRGRPRRGAGGRNHRPQGYAGSGWRRRHPRRHLPRVYVAPVSDNHACDRDTRLG